jgi:hypothetical protein
VDSESESFGLDSGLASDSEVFVLAVEKRDVKS